MFLPALRTNKKVTKRSIIQWAGLNKKVLIEDNQFSATTNLSTKNYPLISPRPSRATSYTLTAGWALFASSKLAWVDGTDFFYNGVDEGNVTASAKSMVEISNRIVIFPDKVSYDTIGDTFASFGTGTYPTAGSVPDIDYACMLDNRIFGVKGDNIYACALGDFDDWTTFSSPSEATDAYQVDTGTLGNFTGIAAFKGTVLAFKGDRVFKLFGDVPEDFQFIEISRLGCQNHKSICEVNDILFWLSDKGIVAYTGGAPEAINDDLNETYISAVAGGDGRKYYISLYNGSTYALYVYDTRNGIWLQEDTLNVKDFAYFEGYLYALASDHKIYKFNSGTETVTSIAITKEFTDDLTEKKGNTELIFMVDLESGSSMKVYTRVNNGSFTLVKTYTTADLSTLRVPIVVNRANHFQIKLEMTGEYKIYQTERKIYVGSEN